MNRANTIVEVLIYVVALIEMLWTLVAICGSVYLFRIGAITLPKCIYYVIICVFILYFLAHIEDLYRKKLYGTSDSE